MTKEAIIEKIKAVDHKPTAKTTHSEITPDKPIYSGFGNIWFVDWRHPDAKNFIPVKLR